LDSAELITTTRLRLRSNTTGRRMSGKEFGSLIARRCGRAQPYSASVVSKWENGRAVPNGQVLQAIEAMRREADDFAPLLIPEDRPLMLVPSSSGPDVRRQRYALLHRLATELTYPSNFVQALEYLLDGVLNAALVRMAELGLSEADLVELLDATVSQAVGAVRSTSWSGDPSHTEKRSFLEALASTGRAVNLMLELRQ
jgi:transcriptional regulator with XRE-family HTH domain